MSIECFALSKHYGQKVALHDVSLEISEGKVTGIVGPNGAGKSTLIKMITGLVHPSEGFVLIDGYDVHAEHREAMRKLGAIVEWPSFYPDLSAKINLAVMSGGYGREYEKKVDEVTRFLNINHVLNRKVGTFSTGMKQRLGIALALLPDSQYVILDEPANGLDPAGIVEIRQLIRDYNRQFGVTVLISSHLLSEIEMICDDIIMIVDGELRACGPLNELLAARNRVEVAAKDMDKAGNFLKQAFADKVNWISSEPLLDCEGVWSFQMPEGTDLAEISSALFQNGLAVTHFAREQQNLEKFYLSNVSGGGK